MSGSNGSNLAPTEDGNTKPSVSAPKSKREAGKKHWFLTLKWTHGTKIYHIGLLQAWIKRNTTRCVMQLEEGESTGYQHFQIQLCLKMKQRFSWFKHHLGAATHTEVTRNIDAAYEYCCKDESRVWGPWKWPEPLQLNDMKDPLEGLTLKPWQNDIKTIIEGPVHDRRIHWFYDIEGGKGKTDFTRHLMLHYEIQFFQGGKKADMAFAWNGQRTCIFNYSRQLEGCVSYDALESLKDGLIFSAKYESGVKFHPKPHVIVFANWPPDTSQLSLDRWHIVELLV